MARADRLFRLLQAMRMMAAPITAAKLAAETGMSLRSIYRDIDSLRAAGARIEGERGYGYQLIEDYALPPQTFDRIEIEAIALGLAEVRGMGDASLAEAAASVLAKLVASLPDDREQQLVHAISHVYRPRRLEALQPVIDLIRRACWDERALDLGYRDVEGQASTRRIHPLALVYTDGALTMVAWCCLRLDYRMFRIDRIEALEATDEFFRPRRAALLREYLARLDALPTNPLDSPRRTG